MRVCAFVRAGGRAYACGWQGWSHLEPVLAPPAENPLLATYTAAWMQVHLNGAPPGSEYYELVYGHDNSTVVPICESQPMVECYIEQP